MDFQQLTGNINKNLGEFAKAEPDMMNAFQSLSKAATKDGALSKKTKELLALALAVGGHCQGCIGFHVQKLVTFGVSKEELMETLSMAVYMGGGPSLMYAAEAIEAYNQFSQ
jgi:AhpD family alkylhydroperoxidase